MPPFETMDLEQKALLWARIGTDKDGEPITDSREEICVRWENRQTQMRAPDSSLVSVDAIVVVDRDIAKGSLMWEGGIEDVPGTDPNPPSGYMEVVMVDEVPSIDGRYMRKNLGLKRFRDSR